jgi:hypothetical protein
MAITLFDAAPIDIFAACLIFSPLMMMSFRRQPLPPLMPMLFMPAIFSPLSRAARGSGAAQRRRLLCGSDAAHAAFTPDAAARFMPPPMTPRHFFAS